MTTNPDAPPTTVLPYGPGNRWTYSSKQSGYTHTEELALVAEPSGTTLTDDYSPDEVGAHDLWKRWVDQHADALHKEWPDQYRPGEVHITWGITGPDRNAVSEYAPHARRYPEPRLSPAEEKAYRTMFGEDGGKFQEDFLTHFTHPVHAVTGERINWLRLPVLDSGWNTTRANQGGFIQELTGWKPSPLQPTMDVRQIGAAAGLYVPPL
ncbi:hypothetical protein [Streptomyces microflavus]|uniref:hypothetical protein n=1 Tax=Streptomyces microflavus TaxID=1919 RepID=UPI002F91317B|nr:hypothetical protein OH770_35870 [Streptomyces microflavus]